MVRIIGCVSYHPPHHVEIARSAAGGPLPQKEETVSSTRPHFIQYLLLEGLHDRQVLAVAAGGKASNIIYRANKAT